MQLQGLHHITMITGDARANVRFYAQTLGLRLVKKTVNFDAPEAYHLYFGDEHGSPGSILTWFEFAGARAGRVGVGMIHTLALGVRSEAALDFWERRLAAHGHPGGRSDGVLAFVDPDGLALELVVSNTAALSAAHPEVPAEHAVTGLTGARAYAHAHDTAEPLLTQTLGFTARGGGAYRVPSEDRGFDWVYDPPPDDRGIPGAGTVHHIAWHARDADHEAWRQKVADSGRHVTPVIDRDYFKSVYFREPRGILFEIATTSPGFAADEDPDHLGEQLRLPLQHERLREQLERTLTPLVNPRVGGGE